MATVGMRKVGDFDNVEIDVPSVENGAYLEAALTLYRQHFGAKGRRNVSVHQSLYAGSERPYGTYHVQFGTPVSTGGTSLSSTFIVNVER